MAYDSATPPQMVDVDGDGNLDVLVANTAGSSMTLYRGDGSGALGIKESIDTVLSPTAFAVSDFDLDGRQDIVVAGDGGVMLHWGGSSGIRERFLLPGSPLDWQSRRFVALAVVDVAGDAYPELVLLGQTGGGSETWVVPGLERYAQRSPALVSTSFRAFKRLQVVDLNNDRLLDIAAWDQTGDVSWATGDGTWITQAGFIDSGQRNEVPLRYLDLNRDGLVDMVSALAIGQGTLLYGYRVRVRLGDGGGGYALVPNTAEPVSDGQRLQLRLEDWDQDGVPDLLLRGEDASTLSVYASRGDGTFEPPVVSAVPGGAGGIASGDLDGDGLLELAALHTSISGLTVHRGLPGGKVDSYLLQLPEATYLRSAQVGSYADQNEPLVAVVGGLDLDTGRFRVLRYDGAGSLSEEQQVPVYRPQSLTLSDVDGDGNGDALIASERALSWLPYLGKGRFGAQLETISAMFGAQDQTAADATGDGVPEVFVRQSASPDHLMYMFSRSGANSPWESTRWSLGSSSRMAVADVTGDGLADIVAIVDTALRVYKGSSGQAPQLAATLALPDQYYQLQLVDLTGDGVSDVLVGDWKGYRAFAGGAGLDFPLLAAAAQPTLYYPYPSAFGRSVNLDEDPFEDLVEPESGGVLALWRGLGDGTFQRAERHLLPGSTGAVGIDDFDADGIPDLLLTGGSQYNGSLLLLKGALQCAK